MLLLVEGPLDTDRADHDRVGLANKARALGHRVLEIPPEATLTPESRRLPGLERGDFAWGVLCGDVPSPERYRRIHDEAREANVTLLNDPQQHLDAVELHRTLPQLDGVTAKTVAIRSPAELDAALATVPLPVFIKSTIHSRKWFGLDACVARDAAQARKIVDTLFAQKSSTREVVLIRELLPLRTTGSTYEGFPISREYRLFVLDADVVGLGFYWPFGDPFGAPTEREDREMRALAHEVARRTRVPWLVVDVGQLESGEWKVIETGDPACSGLATVEPRGLIGAVAHGLELRAGC
ncbi:MAG: ATP-grasp domain-containing protein [Myxococcaceae bacterium]